MKNQEIAQIFYEIAGFLQMDNVPFRTFAYKKAAFSLEGLEQDIEEIYKNEGKKGLKKIPGIGENIAKKIEEYLKTGKIKSLKRLKKK